MKALGYFFPTDMRDDSAIYATTSTKLHVDAEHIAREPAPPGIRMAAMQCIIGSAWRHHARGMWAPTLDQARCAQVHLCRLVVRVVPAVPATDPIKLTGDSGTAPEFLALPISAGGFAMPLFVKRFFLRHGGQHHSRLGPAFYLSAVGSRRVVGSCHSHMPARGSRSVGPCTARWVANPGVEASF